MSYGHLWRLSAAARSSVIVERPVSPRRTFRLHDIGRGWVVEDCDEVRVGTIAQVADAVLTVSRGIFRSKLYVPATFVAQVHEGVIRLTVSTAWIGVHGWDRR